MPENPQFRGDAFERNIAEIGERVALERERRQIPVERAEEAARAVLKDFSTELERGEEPTYAPPEVSHGSPYPHGEADLLPDYVDKGNAGDAVLEIERLVDMALHHDIRRALAIARRRNPFVEDAFHDALVDKILPELKKRGII